MVSSPFEVFCYYYDATTFISITIRYVVINIELAYLIQVFYIQDNVTVSSAEIVW